MPSKKPQAGIPDEKAKLVPSTIEIPSPPVLLLDLDRLMAEDDINITAIAERISQDAGVSAQIFRALNSPVYGLSQPPDSLGKAVSILGLTTLHDLVKAICLRQTLAGDPPTMERFWERSADVAKLAATIAWTQRSVCNVQPEHAHLVGLFHDCGIPLLAKRYPDYCKTFCNGNTHKWPDVRQEDSKFMTDHAVVGALLTRHWGLPEYVIQAVLFHHEIVNVERKAATLVAILQMAIHIYNLRNQQDDSEWDEFSGNVLEELGIHPDGQTEFEEDIYERAFGEH